ncbi:MAG: metallophosphoesterase family protein [Clostridiales bacterium]|nr:metallophosphoesterase family protein [Clostridiales bacterium]
MIYFTSDLHFGHYREFIYGARGFGSIQEHDEALIEHWNSTVKPDDVVYVLGDIMLKDNDHGMKCWNELIGNKMVVWGNHDSAPRRELLTAAHDTEVLGFSSMLDYGGLHFYLSHYPTLTSNYDDPNKPEKRVIDLCGHTHVTDRFADMDKGWIYHVELDCHDNHLVPIEEIISDLGSYKRRV